ncbi:hypothetical protein BN946_scf184990.g11 [Trametes cinnabarina]|uniref:Ammonium transporter AmtB-like domain-containing protein n=1 Tax=Pycnoporus cinnabarinus TaxID=5643 RepID=A0A060SJX1_PYCCI|nr:hypothetical protein BN946_scf184990.g11 [Trametes cinnabarina]
MSQAVDTPPQPRIPLSSAFALALRSTVDPPAAFLYSGLSRRKSALSLVWAVAASNAVVIFQWWFWGYSLAFSPSATNGFIGDLRSFALRKVLADPSPGSPLIPELLYSFYQMEFACVTVAILMGALAERGRVFPAMVFTFIWMTIVYCPIACWAWATNGWGFKWGVLDYAGGGPVEIASGISGLAYSWALGRRSERELRNFRPHNVSLVGLGTFILCQVHPTNRRRARYVPYASRPPWLCADLSRRPDLCAEHAIGGMLGLLFNALFADSAIIALDGVNTSASGGWLNRNWKQLYMQIAYIAACTAYSFVVTALIAKALDRVPTLHLRATPEEEMLGMDDAEIGEFATDYIEVRRDYLDWSPAYHPKDTDSDAVPAAGDRHGVPDVELSTIHANGHEKENGKGAASGNGLANSHANGILSAHAGGDAGAAGTGALTPISEKTEARGES